ncbi:MAG: DNA-binding CsgD family transcriptional regulator [Myxococcota bacterium]|jgi:DNA-binding CsgD family transcriptional regulator
MVEEALISGVGMPTLIERELTRLAARPGIVGALFLRLAWSRGCARVVNARVAGEVPLAHAELQGRTLTQLGWSAAELLPLDQPRTRRVRLGGSGFYVLGNLITAGGVILGWLGVIPSGASVATPALQATQARLSVIEHHGDAAAEASMVLCPGGRPELRCSRAAAWLGMDGFSDALVETIGQMACTGQAEDVLIWRSARVSIETLWGRHHVRYLVRVEPLKSLPVPALARLTEAQLQVAIFAAAGATVGEIARTLERSENTIRSHLKSAYSKLEISSRLELAQQVEQVWPTLQA